MQSIYLKKGREVPVLRGHPWIFSGAVEVEDQQADVGVADIFDYRKNWLARGLYNSKSQIRVRVLTWRKEPIDRDFFLQRLAHASSSRQNYLSRITNAYRLVNGEGDFLPGLVVDRYGDLLVCQIFTAGMDLLKGIVMQSLCGLT